MPPDADTPEERLAELLAELPPAPAAWVDEAAALPRLRREADRLVALCEADAAFRAAVLEDLEHEELSGPGEENGPPGVW
jgi:hypothetical protein